MKTNPKFVNLKKRVVSLKGYLLKNDKHMFFKIPKMLLNALNLLYYKLNITQTIFIEAIGKIIKGR